MCLYLPSTNHSTFYYYDKRGNEGLRDYVVLLRLQAEVSPA